MRLLLAPFVKPVVALAVLMTAVVCVYALYSVVFAARAPLSRKVTYLTTHVQADGIPDYVSAMNALSANGVTPQSNAVVLLRATLGWDGMPPGEIRDAYCTALGVVSPSAERRYLPPLPAPPPRPTGQEDLIGATTARPWTEADFPDMHRWLVANEELLDVAVQASCKDHFFSPILHIDFDSSAEQGTLLEPQPLLDALLARAMCHLGNDDVEAGWRDLLACHRLIALSRQSWSKVQVFRFLARQEALFAAYQTLLGNERLNAHLVATIVLHINSIPSECHLPKTLCVGERCASLQRVVTFSEQFRMTSAEMERAMCMVNDYFDEIEVALQKPTYCDRIAEVASIGKRYRQAAEMVILKAMRSGKTGSFVAEHAFQNSAGDLDTAYLRYEARFAAHSALIKAAFAIEAYRLSSGQFPRELSVVVPEHLSAMPLDPYDGAPLRFRCGKSGYVLCSVGPNGVHEHDALPQAADNEQTADDIVITRRADAPDSANDP